MDHLYGGRGVYFYDPNGHLLELITRPYRRYSREVEQGGGARPVEEP